MTREMSESYISESHSALCSAWTQETERNLRPVAKHPYKSSIEEDPSLWIFCFSLRARSYKRKKKIMSVMSYPYYVEFFGTGNADIYQHLKDSDGNISQEALREEIQRTNRELEKISDPNFLRTQEIPSVFLESAKIWIQTGLDPYTRIANSFTLKPSSAYRDGEDLFVSDGHYEVHLVRALKAKVSDLESLILH